MTEDKQTGVQALQWTGHSLKVLDQRQLPDNINYDEYNDARGVADAIASMRVRGAPAIGIAAAYGVALSIKQHYSPDNVLWRQEIDRDIDALAHSRPTAVNLFWALGRMKAVLADEPENPIEAALACAGQIHADDIAANRTMGELGADILTDFNVKGILTHCNTGALATGGYGTALGVIRSMVARKPGIQVYAGETRPWLQGQRLTVWELAQDNIPVTLIADSAAAWLMKSGAIDWIIVGADRVAMNGDTANKIGTYGLAVLAKRHGVKVMVVTPTSTIDRNLMNGELIEIEQRQQSELLPNCYNDNPCVSAWNPVFDVTPAELISVIVTEKGCVMNPSATGLRELFND
ncbi:MAG: S-methyl-5-thioribose-1-phosphate isomerase [Gammaproteobacteria bacterium]|nr:S-methyl-5-thioribose-1-phosphate isomerase [Gammaproteobacteria bacterium]